MEFNDIAQRKPFYKVKAGLKEHLKMYSRVEQLPLSYEDLIRYEDLIPLYNDSGNPTLWYSVLYRSDELAFFQKSLIEIYQKLHSEGDQIPYLKIDRIEFCSFGNSKPFRIRVVNEINDNYDYYYVKQADASRVYGLELEEIFSPDKINYLIDRETLIEEHIVGIPVDEFILRKNGIKVDNRLRLAKEFVKFNERCFVRLLGDMRAYNFVVELTQDFDNIQYRLRAMDFDQQSYEGRKNIYKPQFYKDNIELVELAQDCMSVSMADQYRRMERVAMKKRYLSARQRTKSLLRRMRKDKISTKAYVTLLAEELGKHHNDKTFEQLTNMGAILNRHLECSLGVQILSQEAP